MNTAVITLQDFTGERHAVVISRCRSNSDANTLAQFLSAQSDAVVISVRFVEETLWADADPHQGSAYDCVAQRLKLWYHDEGNRHIIFEIPAPKENTLTEDQKATAGIKESIAELLIQCTEANEIFYQNSGLVSLIPE